MGFQAPIDFGISSLFGPHLTRADKTGGLSNPRMCVSPVHPTPRYSIQLEQSRSSYNVIFSRAPIRLCMLSVAVDKDMQSRNEQTTVISNPNMLYFSQICNLVGEIIFTVWRQQVWNFHHKPPERTNSVLQPSQVRPLGGRINFQYVCKLLSDILKVKLNDNLIKPGIFDRCSNTVHRDRRSRWTRSYNARKCQASWTKVHTCASMTFKIFTFLSSFFTKATSNERKYIHVHEWHLKFSHLFLVFPLLTTMTTMTMGKIGIGPIRRHHFSVWPIPIFLIVFRPRSVVLLRLIFLFLKVFNYISQVLYV